MDGNKGVDYFRHCEIYHSFVDHDLVVMEKGDFSAPSSCVTMITSCTLLPWLMVADVNCGCSLWLQVMVVDVG